MDRIVGKARSMLGKAIYIKLDPFVWINARLGAQDMVIPGVMRPGGGCECRHANKQRSVTAMFSRALLPSVSVGEVGSALAVVSSRGCTTICSLTPERESGATNKAKLVLDAAGGDEKGESGGCGKSFMDLIFRAR